MNTCPSFQFGWRVINGHVEPFTWPKPPRDEITSELRRLINLVAPIVREAGEVTIACPAGEHDPSRVNIPQAVIKKCAGGVIGQILFIAIKGASDLGVAHAYATLMNEPLKQAVKDYAHARQLTMSQLASHRLMLSIAPPEGAFISDEEQLHGIALVVSTQVMFDRGDRGWFIMASGFPEELPFGQWVNGQTRDKAHNMLIAQMLGKPIAPSTDSIN